MENEPVESIIVNVRHVGECIGQLVLSGLEKLYPLDNPMDNNNV